MCRIEAAREDDLAAVRALFEEYAESLGVDLGFQDFEAELRSLPGRYAPPEGRLLVARRGGTVVGCVALRRIAAGVCEMKRLFVRPASRQLGLGWRLATALVHEAGRSGYREMRLDTLPSMQQARRVYRRMGFREIAPYYDSPIPGTTFMACDLRTAAVGGDPGDLRVDESGSA